MAGPIRISVLADGSGAKRTFASVGGSAKGMSARVGGAVRGVGLATAAGFGVAVAAGGLWAKASVTSLARIERINAQTAQTIKSTGGAARVNAKHVENLAGRLEKLTATEAESTQEGANLLLTFTNIQNKVGKGNKIFDRATSTLVDMSRALGTEPKAAAIQLGKALNDPVKGVTALRKVGVSFTEQQQKQIKTLAESGRGMKAQKIILGELNKEFGGSGKAFAKTAEGQKALLGHSLGTLGETIFAPLLPWLTKVTGKTTVFVDYLNANVGPAFRTVERYIGPVVDRLKGLFDTTDAGNSRIGSSVSGVLATYQKFYATFVPIIESVALAVSSKWGEIEPQVRAIWGSVQRTVLSALQIIQSVVGIATKVVLAIWSRFGDTITRYVTRSLVATITILRGAFQIIEGVFKVVASLLRGDWKGVWDGIKKITSGALTVVKGSLQLGLAALRALATVALAALKAIFAKAWDGVVALVKFQLGSIVTLVKGLKGKISGALGDAKAWLVQTGRDIIQGLLDGIDELIGQVTAKINGLKDKVTEGVKGIGDKLNPFGRVSANPLAFLAAGVTDGTSGVEKAIKRLTDRIEDAYDKGLDRTKKRIDRKYDAIEKRLRKTLKGAALSAALGRNDRAHDKAISDAEKGSTKRQRDVLALVRAHLPALRANAREQDRITEKLKAARDVLADLQRQQSDYAASVRDMITGTGSIGTLGEGAGFSSVAQLIAQRTDAVTQATQFSSVIDQLRAAGLNDADLRDLVDQGPGSLAAATAILNGGSGQIGQLNGLQAQLAALGTSLGATAADQFYGTGVAAAQGIITGLEAQAATLDKAAVKLANALAKAVKKALKGLGADVVAGMKVGLADTHARSSNGSPSRPKGFGAPALDAWAATNGTANGARTLTLRLSSREVDQLRRGREIQADLDAYHGTGRTRR